MFALPSPLRLLLPPIDFNFSICSPPRQAPFIIFELLYVRPSSTFLPCVCLWRLNVSPIAANLLHPCCGAPSVCLPKSHVRTLTVTSAIDSLRLDPPPSLQLPPSLHLPLSSSLLISLHPILLLLFPSWLMAHVWLIRRDVFLFSFFFFLQLSGFCFEDSVLLTKQSFVVVVVW